MMQTKTAYSYEVSAHSNDVCLGFCGVVDGGISIPAEQCEQPGSGVCLMVVESVCETYSCVKDAAWRFADLCVTVTGALLEAAADVLRVLCHIVDEVDRVRVKAWSMLCRLLL